MQVKKTTPYDADFFKYPKKIKNKKYCNKPECQKRRNAIKSMMYSQRKKQENL